MKLVPVLQLAKAVHKRHDRDGGGYLAAMISYYGFLSLFPLLLLAMSAVGFVLAGDARAQAEWAARLTGAVPGLGSLIGKNIRALVEGRGATGAVGVLGLLWAGTGLAEASGYALGRVFGVPELRNVIRRKAWSLASTLALGALAAAGVAVAGLAAGGGLWRPVLAIGLAFALDTVLFLVAYRLLIQRRGPSFEFLWKGALLAAAGWTALKIGGGWYAARAVRGSAEVYGTFASVVGVLVVIYLASRVFLYGAELNAVLIERTGGGSVLATKTTQGNGQSATKLTRSLRQVRRSGS